MNRALSIPFVTTLCAALAGLFPGLAAADEESVKKSVATWFGANVKVEAARKLPVGGLYEVQVQSGRGDKALFYTDDKVSFVLDGQLIDAKSRRNLTQEQLNKLSAINFSELPLANAVRLVRGNGRRVLATFEDPNCGYCKKLAQELRKLDDVTIYTFIIPILGQDSSDKSRAIWCSADRNKAWNDWITAGVQPGGGQCDTAALQKNLDLANRYRIQGTPTMFFSNGERAPGYMVAAQIEQRLAAVK